MSDILKDPTEHVTVTQGAIRAVTGEDSPAVKLEATLADVVAEAGLLCHDGYHENPRHGDAIAKARASLKKAGVEL